MHTFKRATALAGLACVAATALLTVPGSANAASRQFKVFNASSETFELEEVRQVKCLSGDSYCSSHQRGWYDMEFEGRPAEGAKLESGDSHEFELKYYFTASPGRFNYAANLHYDDFSVRITTTNYNNDSDCWVYAEDKPDLKCVANGRLIRIRDR